jgi:hypothetical protein
MLYAACASPGGGVAILAGGMVTTMSEVRSVENCLGALEAIAQLGDDGTQALAHAKNGLVRSRNRLAAMESTTKHAKRLETMWNTAFPLDRMPAVPGPGTFADHMDLMSCCKWIVDHDYDDAKSLVAVLRRLLVVTTSSSVNAKDVDRPIAKQAEACLRKLSTGEGDEKYKTGGAVLNLVGEVMCVGGVQGAN